MTDSIEYMVRRRHVRSLLNYLEEERTGLHVTDLVYGCPRYASYVMSARRDKAAKRNIDEGGLLRLAMGRLLDSLPIGDWHHVDLVLEKSGLMGQIDDIIYRKGIGGDELLIVDKKTIVEKPPREAHDHYLTQVLIYAYMLRYGSIVGCECGDLDLLRKLSKSSQTKLRGAILYVDVSVSTKTMVSDVKVFDIDSKALADVEKFLEHMLSGVNSLNPEAVPSWFCHYCPIMNDCWRGEW